MEAGLFIFIADKVFRILEQLSFKKMSPLSGMDVFKLFFEHDLRLDELGERNTGSKPTTGPSIEEFMRPDPTYSKFYFTGTRLEEEKFGLNNLENYPSILDKLNTIFKDYNMHIKEGVYSQLSDALESVSNGEPIFISKEKVLSHVPSSLRINQDSNIGHFKTELSTILLDDIKVLYKENAHHGFDLHLFSKENIYRKFFYPLKELVSNSFRFFSINSKRVRSERLFYFETWALEKPPHGAEEVRPETVL